MSTQNKLAAGADFPALSLPKVGGGEIKLRVRPPVGGCWWSTAASTARSASAISRRSTVCSTNIALLAWKWRWRRAIPRTRRRPKQPKRVGASRSLTISALLGLYISNPRSPQETDRPFSEPGLFLVNPEGKAQIIDIGNSPWSRPDLANILNGVKIIQERNYPIRGTAD
jgi:hypothetical protein